MNQKRIEQISESLLVTVIVPSNLVIAEMLVVTPFLFTDASRDNLLQKFPVKSTQNLLTFCITAVTLWLWGSAQVDLGQE